MIKETINYTDYNGTERSMVCRFNLNKAEIVKMEMSVAGGMAERIQRIIDTHNQPELIEIFEDLIARSYGVLTPDGNGFDKSPEHLKAFKATEAYSELFMKLATDADFAAKFINGIFPADLVKQAALAQGNN